MPIAPEHLALLYTGPFDAYLYGRNSRDPKMKGSSVDDQMHEGREICNDNGWPIKREFTDVGRSASRYAKRERKEFEEMIAGIEAGDCRILVAWEASRYYRDLEVYVRLRNVCMQAGVLLCYNGTVYDLSKRADRKATAQDALQAEDEAEGIRDRNLRTARLNAKAGMPHGRILWGYARRYDPDTGDLVEQYPHPERAAVVTSIFERIAAGETEYSILQTLRAKGDRLPGLRWENHHLRSMLRNPSYKGSRVFQGAELGEAKWPGLVDAETYEAVQAIIKRPERRTMGSSEIVHLLSGLSRCGECPTAPPLRVLKCRGYKAYQCSEKFDTVMREEKLDAYVEEAVIEWLQSKAPAAAFASEDGQRKVEAARLRHAQMQAQLDEARAKAAKFGPDGKPKLSIESLAALETSLLPLIEEARAQAGVLVGVPPVLRGIIGRSDVDAIWHNMSLEQRRSVLRTVVDIRLMKARAQGVRTIEPGRIRLTFVGEPGFIGWRPGPVLRRLADEPETESR
ncbi:recombinase family protein [Streptomyces sp. DT224]|uniref:recombinase family protein n=1 Tax=Streptomyces sp. DT224 TaxID=3393426 RepID=UPI003CF80EA3